MPERLWIRFKRRGCREGDDRDGAPLLQCPCWVLANTVTLKRQYQVNEPNIIEDVFSEWKITVLLVVSLDVE